MKVFSISYDLNKPGQSYPAIITRLETLGAKRVLYSHWMLRHGGYSAETLRNDLMNCIDQNDRLLVIDTTTGAMAWHNMMVPTPAFKQAMSFA